MGKVLFVNLSTGSMKEQRLEEKLCQDFVGGYGVGSRLLCSRQKSGVDSPGAGKHSGVLKWSVDWHSGAHRRSIRGCR